MITLDRSDRLKSDRQAEAYTSAVPTEKNQDDGTSDVELIEACLRGEEEAWEVLLKRYSRLIYTIPIRFGFSQLVADEIFQETCLVLLEKLETLSKRERLHAWLVTVTKRACIQRMRKHKREGGAIHMLPNDKTDGLHVEDQLLLLEQKSLVHAAIANMEPKCKQLLTALFFDEPPKSYETISVELNIPIGSIGPTRKRCLEKLRQEIAILEAGVPI
ncbi:sigma-70 family RNA polymerase sigma factor [Chloroflexi bacterium TSY]|nr:sigma-70 family RNA polymerase sigma factor [Chloroflexi bacterium TSY]